MVYTSWGLSLQTVRGFFVSAAQSQGVSSVLYMIGKFLLGLCPTPCHGTITMSQVPYLGKGHHGYKSVLQPQGLMLCQRFLLSNHRG